MKKSSADKWLQIIGVAALKEKQLQLLSKHTEKQLNYLNAILIFKKKKKMKGFVFYVCMYVCV